MELNDTQKKVLDLVSEMSVLELSQLVKAMEEKFGVSAQAAVAVAAAPAGGAAPAAEEKDSFDVILESVGDKKIEVIKVVKNATGLGLAEAKALVDAAPKAVKEAASKADADKLKAELEAAGAKVTLK